MFAHYWPGDGVQQTIVTPYQGYHFPHYFNGSTVSSFGAGQMDTRAFAKRFKGALIKHIWRKFPTRLIATFLALKLIWSSDFTLANAAIREIAQDPSSRSLSTWGDIHREAVSNAKQGENVYRNFAARLILKHPQAGPLVELAWLAWKARGR